MMLIRAGEDDSYRMESNGEEALKNEHEGKIDSEPAHLFNGFLDEVARKEARKKDELARREVRCEARKTHENAEFLLEEPFEKPAQARARAGAPIPRSAAVLVVGAVLGLALLAVGGRSNAGSWYE